MSQERQYLDLFYTAPSILVKHLHPYSISPEEAYLSIQVFIVLLDEMLFIRTKNLFSLHDLKNVLAYMN